jgi:hypothetical protein
MKYTNEIEIELPVNRVVELFDDPQNLKYWMKGLISFENLSGEPGQPGAKSKLRFKEGKREIEMIETVTVRNLPDEFSGTYELPGAWNGVTNRFADLGNGKTKYISESEFKFKGIAMQVISYLMPGAFKKQSYKYMKAFKEFAESQH